ncbi:MAG: S-layer homology domain-containing protein [Oscillospiraceae bacterium]
MARRSAAAEALLYVVTHLTHDGAAEYVSGSDLEIQFTPEEGYVLPETVSVTGDQEIIRYTYNPDTGLLTILHATGNLTITAEGVSETAEPEPIDTTVLEALLESTKEAYEHPEDYEAGEAYDNFRAAYTAAAEVLEAPETQEQVDEAVKNLREAFEALTKISYAVIAQDLKGVTSDAPKQVQVGSDLTVQLTADSGYLLPVSVTLSPAEAFQDAAYDADTGILTLQGVTGDLTIAAEGVPFAYADVAETHWFYDEVAYVTRWGLMNGMENNRFYPNNSMSRAMVATVLYRMAGSPEVTGTTPFTDVKEDRYYSDAVVWCYQNGITMGVTETRFGGRQHGQPPAGGYVPVPPC